jgi:hypothetical protein
MKPQLIAPEVRELIQSMLVEVLASQAPPKEERNLTIEEFCRAEHISKATYFKLQKLGQGPDELRVPGCAFKRITPQARREWHERMEKQRQEQAQEAEIERRKAHARYAGKLAARSPLHVSNVKRRRKADREAK